MPNLVPQTAIRGTSQSSFDRLAKTLGYFSIALGMTELLAPRAVCRAAGIDGHEALIRGYGAREIATGVAILMSHDATPWIWGRVAGDAADVATVLAASQNNRGGRENTALALATLLGVTALDIYCAKGLSAEKGGRYTAITDYSGRSGFPRGAQAAQGAARDFEAPRDFRTPEALRPTPLGQRDTSASRGAATAPI